MRAKKRYRHSKRKRKRTRRTSEHIRDEENTGTKDTMEKKKQ